MLNKIISIIVCMPMGHNLVSSASCPFTGITYKYCGRCKAMIPTQKAEE